MFGGLSGLAAMSGGLMAIREGRAMAFEEEYGLESLWHEIEHNAQRHVQPPDTPERVVRIVEGLHQTLARQTYPRLLVQLGAAPRHIEEIRRSGRAYRLSARGYARMLQSLDLMDERFGLREDAVAALRRTMVETPYPQMAERVADALVRLSGRPRAEIAEWLNRIAAGYPAESDQ